MSCYNIGISDGEESDIIGILDVLSSDIGFFWDSSDIIFPHPNKSYIGLLTIQYSYNIALSCHDGSFSHYIFNLNLLNIGPISKI